MIRRRRRPWWRQPCACASCAAALVVPVRGRVVARVPVGRTKRPVVGRPAAPREPQAGVGRGSVPCCATRPTPKSKPGVSRPTVRPAPQYGVGYPMRSGESSEARSAPAREVALPQLPRNLPTRRSPTTGENALRPQGRPWPRADTGASPWLPWAPKKQDGPSATHQLPDSHTEEPDDRPAHRHGAVFCAVARGPSRRPSRRPRRNPRTNNSSRPRTSRPTSTACLEEGEEPWHDRPLNLPESASSGR